MPEWRYRGHPPPAGGLLRRLRRAVGLDPHWKMEYGVWIRQTCPKCLAPLTWISCAYSVRLGWDDEGQLLLMRLIGHCSVYPRAVVYQTFDPPKRLVGFRVPR
jgi:hypothetical protein